MKIPLLNPDHRYFRRSSLGLRKSDWILILSKEEWTAFYAPFSGGVAGVASKWKLHELQEKQFTEISCFDALRWFVWWYGFDGGNRPMDDSVFDTVNSVGVAKKI